MRNVFPKNAAVSLKKMTDTQEQGRRGVAKLTDVRFMLYPIVVYPIVSHNNGIMSVETGIGKIYASFRIITKWIIF